MDEHKNNLLHFLALNKNATPEYFKAVISKSPEMLLLENDLSKSVDIIEMLMQRKDNDGKHLATKRNKMTRLPLMISVIESDFMTFNETLSESDLPTCIRGLGYWA